MNAYLQATEVTLTVPLKDDSGNQLSVTGIEYRVTDEIGSELVARVALDTFTPLSPDAAVVIAATHNALGEGVPRALRQVELFCTIGGNIVVHTAVYVVERPDPLVVGLNSFQGYALAQFVALDIPNLAGWDNASETERIAALIDAREHICQLNFQQLSRYSGQDSLNYAQEGTRDIGTGVFGFTGDLKTLTPAQYLALPLEFRTALNKAQIAEANVILGGDPVEAKRQDGLLQDAVGESRQAFRPGKPLQLPVSRRALGYLSQFVTFSKQIGRG